MFIDFVAHFHIILKYKYKGGKMLIDKQYVAFGLVVIIAFMSISCAPGNDRWDQEISPGHQAGFWAGIWHGLIIVITFIVSLFTDEVGLYEVNNTGWSYNLGFLIGLCISIGGGLGPFRWWRRHKRYDWHKMGDEIEERVRLGVKSWLEETKKEEREKEWEEIAKKIEERMKRVLKEWAEKQ